MRKRNPVEGSNSRVYSNSQGESNLEIKKKALKEYKSNPEVIDLTESPGRSKFSEKSTSDSTPTGLLEEEEDLEEVYERRSSEESKPTGLLDEDDYEEDLPEVKPKKLVEDEPKEAPQRKRRSENAGLDALEGRRKDLSGDRSRREAKRRPQNTQQNARDDLEEEVEEEFPVRPEDKRRAQNTNRGGGKGNNGNRSVKTQQRRSSGNSSKGRKNEDKGSGGAVAIVILLLVILFIVAFFVIRAVRPDLISGLFDGNRDNPPIGTPQTQQQQTVTEDLSNSVYYANVVNAINNLYTDGDKHDIREDVTNLDVKTCLDSLEAYRTSAEYNESAFNELSNELQTISLFLQDRDIYNMLMNDNSTYTDEEYEQKLQGIRNDIMMYRVQSLVSAMNAKLSILETMSTVTGSDNIEDMLPEDTTTKKTVETEAPETESRNVMQAWGNGTGVIVEGESE